MSPFCVLPKPNAYKQSRPHDSRLHPPGGAHFKFGDGYGGDHSPRPILYFFVRVSFVYIAMCGAPLQWTDMGPARHHHRLTRQQTALRFADHSTLARWWRHWRRVYTQCLAVRALPLTSTALGVDAPRAESNAPAPLNVSISGMCGFWFCIIPNHRFSSAIA
jgi:hypothetical protein